MKIFRRVSSFLVAELRRGLTARELALTLAVGLCLSVPPVLGSTTALCALAALLLRLNQPLIQAINYLAYPLQLILLIPFLKAGEWVFGASHTPLSPGKMLSMAKADLLGTISALWTVTWHGVVVWAVASVPIGLLVFWLAKPFLERLAARLPKQEPSRVA
ncbi:MAG: DUF2062 domain-containing protein [Thermoanaerobaculia bacterium]